MFSIKVKQKKQHLNVVLNLWNLCINFFSKYKCYIL